MAIVNGLIGVAHVIPSFLFLKSKWSCCIEETIIAIKQSALIFTFFEFQLLINISEGSNCVGFQWLWGILAVLIHTLDKS